MSYFYLKPVQGNISLHILEECVLQRWDFLLNFISKNANVNNSCQYLAEGSVYDNIGHFTLNYLSLCSDNDCLIDAVMQYEIELFHRRLIFGTPNSIRLLSKHILKYTRQLPNHCVPYVEVLEEICTKLIIKHIANHILSADHSQVCNIYNINCHFTMCLDLVKSRCVEIKDGIAKIPCGRWITFFKHIFGMHLKHRKTTFVQNSPFHNTDLRYREIILKLTQSMTYFKDSKSALDHKEIDKKVIYFPLCMKNLHNTLRIKHRLSHNERFRYSLFLKDIGMSMQQSIHFWQNEYSKPSLHHTACCHSWDKDSKKYIYGIRHMYGLEGSRKKYSMVKCKSMQYTATKEGGCPFKHFDSAKLNSLFDMNVLSHDQRKEIIHLVNSTKYSEACTSYKNAVMQSICKSETLDTTKASLNVYSPVEYFRQINSITS